LTISNDVEFFNFEVFESLMRFCNTDQQTALGKGLNIELTSSMFFFTDDDITFSYYGGHTLSARKTDYADRIAEYIKSGWIDTNHSFGCFDTTAAFTRQHAVKVYGELDRINAKLHVFTNHGNTNNIQRVGKDLAYYSQGDKVNSLAYHADLFKQNGIEYVWTDTLMDHGTEHTKYKAFKKSVKNFAIDLLNKKGFIKIGPRVFHKNQQKYDVNKLLLEIDLQDGQLIRGFRRLKHPEKCVAPNFSSLNAQLQQINWHDFYNVNGAVVVYQHLGVLFKKDGKFVPTNISFLKDNPEYLAGFRFIKKEKEKLNLCVLGTYRFLRYLDMLSNTEVQIDDRKKQISLSCKIKIKCDPQDYFQGLTIYTTSKDTYSVFLEDMCLETQKNENDESGNPSVTIKPTKLNNIW